MPARLVQ